MSMTSAAPHRCAKASQVLTNMGPCRLSGNQVTTLCTAAVAELVANNCSSSCIAAGNAMLAAPCRIHPDLGQCQVHIDALNACS